jgi:hypothetical protein
MLNEGHSDTLFVFKDGTSVGGELQMPRLAQPRSFCLPSPGYNDDIAAEQ